MTRATLLFTVQSPAGDSLAAALSKRLDEPIVTVTVSSLASTLNRLVAEGAARVVMLPVSPAAESDRPLWSHLLRVAARRLPNVTVQMAKPPDWQAWASLVATHARDVNARSVALTASSSGDELADGNVVRHAWMVERRGRALGVPSLTAHAEFAEVAASVDLTVDAATAMVRTTAAENWQAPPALLDLLCDAHRQALADDPVGSPSWVPYAPTNSLEMDTALTDLERRIDEMLPPAYAGRAESVSPRSMGTAALVHGADGKVAWDQIWTSFCDLALAGGPAHRGTLLEAVTSTEVLADLDGYARVVEELERGLRMVTGLPIVRSASPGWIGVRCDSEEMAAWLLRAIIVENVMVRREGEVIFLPAGPQFRVHKEIKNVITSVAKTCHYWSSHRKSGSTGRS